MRYLIRLHFPASNNVAEYEALVNGLRIAIELGIRRLDVQGNSQLVVNQVMKNSSCHDSKMATYCREVRRFEDKFNGLELNHVPRQSNEAAYWLVKLASGREPVPSGIFASTRVSLRFVTTGRARMKLTHPVLDRGLDVPRRNQAALTQTRGLDDAKKSQLVQPRLGGSPTRRRAQLVRPRLGGSCLRGGITPA